MKIVTKEKLEFYKKGGIITLTFDTQIDTFNEYATIFVTLSELDKLYFCFSNNIKPPYGKITIVHSQISTISKKSPFILQIFSEITWHEVLIAVLSLTRKSAWENLKVNLEDFDKFLDSFEKTIKDVTSGFPDIEREFIGNFLRYYMYLEEYEKEIFLAKIRRIGRGLRKITNIKK